jgi:hypothetical protein
MNGPLRRGMRLLARWRSVRSNSRAVFDTLSSDGSLPYGYFAGSFDSKAVTGDFR